MAILTLAQYKVLDDSPSPLANTAQVSEAITVASGIIEEFTGRTFVINPSPSVSPIEDVDTLNGYGTNRLFVKNAPISAVSKVEYNDGVNWVEVDAVSHPYVFKENSNIVYWVSGYTAFKGYQNWRVTYTYEYDTIPEDIKWACFALAQHIILYAERQGIETQSDGEQSFTYDNKIPKQIMDRIHRYRTVY